MKQIFNGTLVNFRVQKNKLNDNFVLLLHGWGGSLNSFRGTEEFLIANNFSVINMDFPGFGASEIPNENYKLDDYVKIVEEMLKFLEIKKIKIIAHSFGGRVAIKFASNTDYVEKLVLVDSAGIKPRFNFKTFLKIKKYKLLKSLKEKNLIKKDLTNYGSSDFKALPKELKPVFVRVINEDLTNCLNSINCPTLLIWGDKDKSTPLYMAKKMNKLIKNSGIVIYKNAGHFSYLERHNEFLLVLNSFFSKIS